MSKITDTPAKLAFYHPNLKCTGAAVSFQLFPAHDVCEGYILLTLAPQMTVGNQKGPNPTFPRFDWENKIEVKINFEHIAMFMQVLRGECESINEGKGFLVQSGKGSAIVKFEHRIDPSWGYFLSVGFTPSAKDGQDTMGSILFTPAEALGLCECLASCLMWVAFGVPKVPTVE